MRDAKFKVGDSVIREGGTVVRKIVAMEWDEEDNTWYLSFSEGEDAVSDEKFYRTVKLSETCSIGIEQLSVEELASLVEKAEKLLKQKQEECQKEIEDWIAGHTCYGEIDSDDLKAELFDNTQSVIDMLQRYLDKKGK